MAAAAAAVAVIGKIGAKVEEMSAIQKTAEANARGFDHNAQLKEDNADQIIRQSAEDERRLRVMNRRDLGTMQASYGASGVTMDGSPLDVLQETVAHQEMDALTIRKQGEGRAMGLRSDAGFDRETARRIRVAGKEASNPLKILIPGSSAAASAYPTFAAYSTNKAPSQDEGA